MKTIARIVMQMRKTSICSWFLRVRRANMAGSWWPPEAE